MSRTSEAEKCEKLNAQGVVTSRPPSMTDDNLFEILKEKPSERSRRAGFTVSSRRNVYESYYLLCGRKDGQGEYLLLDALLKSLMEADYDVKIRRVEGTDLAGNWEGQSRQ